ncbi:MAG: hypothetical protein R2791_13585 [Saprospiraceae bacterium]
MKKTKRSCVIVVGGDANNGKGAISFKNAAVGVPANSKRHEQINWLQLEICNALACEDPKMKILTSGITATF